MDNLPPEMIRGLVDLFAHEGSKVERAAVVCDVRGGEYFESLADAVDSLEARRLCPTGSCSWTPPRTRW